MNPALRFLSANHWAIVPSVFDALLRVIEQHDAGHRATADEIRQAQGGRAAMFEGAAGGGEPVMVIRGDTAIIQIRGVLARYSDQINGACQDQGRSAESIQADLAQATAMPGITRIILRIDSPGGSVAGTAETGAAIKAASEAGKRVVAYVDGLAASAAYWLASQADEIVASSDGALVGSIGVIMATVDATKAQEKQGYRVNVHRSVDLKAPGTANESMTPAQSASIGKVLSGMHTIFAAAVADGRHLSQSQIDAAATGEVFTAASAIGMGLADRVATWGAVLADSSRTGGTNATKKLAVNAAALSSVPVPNRKELPMPSSIEQVRALVKASPAHAELILDMAAKDSTEDDIRGAVKAKDDEEANAKTKAAHAALLVSVSELRDALAVANADLVASDAKTADLVAKLAALNAHDAGNKVGNKVTGEGDAQAKRMKRSEFEKDQAKHAEDVRTGAIKLVD